MAVEWRFIVKQSAQIAVENHWGNYCVENERSESSWKSLGKPLKSAGKAFEDAHSFSLEKLLR